MDPNANDITQLEFLKRNLLLLKDRAGEHGLIALKVLPKDLLHLLTEELSDAAFSKIKGQQYVNFDDYAEFRHRQIAQIMQRMLVRSLEVGMTGPVLTDLDDAPTLSHWVAILDPEYGGTILIGEPIGHPTCKGPLSHTSRLCALDQAGHWARTTTRWYRLTQADGASVAGDVTVKDNGSFEVFDENLDDFAELPALQIAFKRDDREARGWVHNDLLLSIGSRRRLTAGALSRLMRRDGTDDDIQALLDYLSVQADKHLRIFNLPVASDDGEDAPKDTDEQTVSVLIDDLAPTSDLDKIEGFKNPAGSAGQDHFETAMLRLRRMLLGHGRKIALSRADNADAVVAEDEENDERQRTNDDDAYISRVGRRG